jgi:excinuclease ABC subunit C
MAAEQTAVREKVARLPGSPGVYRMLDARGVVIYVGKARDLRKRVGSYFTHQTSHTPKVRAMVAQIDDLEVMVTRNENEALILESNLIKELRPRYNVVLRDDKSYPYIYVTTDQEYPRIGFHRGPRVGNGRYFGPFPNAGAVRSTLNLLQKLFAVRQCEDTYFANRSRPCLQYQIKRCSGPCVKLIPPEDYRNDIEHALMFLAGRSQEVIEILVRQMEQTAARLDFERAAQLRDQIAKLQRVQAEQHITADAGDFDIVVCRTRDGIGCVQVSFMRAGLNLGNKTFFPAHTRDASESEIVEAFLPQFYLTGNAERDVPPDIILEHPVDDDGWLNDALSERRRTAVRLRLNVRGERAKWLEMALRNVELALAERIATDIDQQRRMEALREALEMTEVPARIECFDVSHTRGEATVASCVVFGPEGARKSDYRRFNIEGVTPGDDYAAMGQALERRYGRLKREDSAMPDLLLIDGGPGQVAQALTVLKELQIDEVMVVGVAKGTSRKPGLEHLIINDGRDEQLLPRDSPALHLIQQIRDEAHRFAITAHRQARSRARKRSPLEAVPGIGAKRRQRVIQHFGGLQGVARASIDDLQKVPGISKQLAQQIFDALREST